MAIRLQTAVALGFAVGLLSACGNSKPNPTDPGYIGQEGPASSGSMPGGSILGDSSMVFGTAKDRPGGGSSGGGAGGTGGGALGVNAYLWRGALDTLSFMPLASADPFGGVIITDWYTPAYLERRALQGHGLHPRPRAAQRRRARQHLPPGAAERPMGGCAGEPGHRRRYREQGAVARPRAARAVAGEQLDTPLPRSGGGRREAPGGGVALRRSPPPAAPCAGTSSAARERCAAGSCACAAGGE